jgi:hypothetical protein
MSVNFQATPWTALGSREISDGNGNVVQYTPENIGMICLAVNAHAKLYGALAKIMDLLHGDGSGDEEIRKIVEEATGRVGFAVLAARIEAAPAGSHDLDRAISTEMQIPEGPYTSSIDAAFKILPDGWSPTASTIPQLDAATNEVVNMAVVDLKRGDKSVTGVSRVLPLSICAAVLKAME